LEATRARWRSTSAGTQPATSSAHRGTIRPRTAPTRHRPAPPRRIPRSRRMETPRPTRRPRRNGPPCRPKPNTPSTAGTAAPAGTPRNPAMVRSTLTKPGRDGTVHTRHWTPVDRRGSSQPAARPYPTPDQPRTASTATAPDSAPKMAPY
jgi:hypothetical protein